MLKSNDGKGRYTMALTVQSRNVDGVVVVDMIGRITCGEPQKLLRDTIRRFLDDGNNKFVFNLSDVNYIDSSGLGELAWTRRCLTDEGGEANLLGVTKRVNNLLVLTKLATVYNFFEEESQAIAALRRS